MSGRSITVRRSPWLRACALLSVLVLLLAGAADAYGLHRCAHHDALPGESGEHGDHAAGHDHAAPTPHDAPAHDDGGCTCVSDCAGSSGLESANADEPVELHFATAVVSEPAPATMPRAAHSPHTLPFAQAPPLDR